MVKVEFGSCGDEFITIESSCCEDQLTVTCKYDGDGNILPEDEWRALTIRVDNCGMHALAMALLERLQLTDRRGPG